MRGAFDLDCIKGKYVKWQLEMQKSSSIELIEEAVEAAKENAKLNGLNNCEFLAGDVAEIIKTVKYIKTRNVC